MPRRDPKDLYLDIGKFIFLCYRLVSGEPISISDGSLDKALRLLCSSVNLPIWIIENLRFKNTSKGWRCINLPLIIFVSERAGFLENFDSSLRNIRVNISEQKAIEELSKLKVNDKMARFYGNIIVSAIKHVKEANLSTT